MTEPDDRPSLDVRWVQRYRHFTKALGQLRDAVTLADQRPLSRLEEQGLVQAFEFTHELAWNALKDFLEDRGVQDVFGSKDATREAFKAGLIEDGETWMHMIRSRNLSSHTYNEETAARIVLDIRHRYFAAFERLSVRLLSLQQERG
jgi:nucleotidyltransferase substrate binding protein (TIGR01987 family)